MPPGGQQPRFFREPHTFGGFGLSTSSRKKTAWVKKFICSIFFAPLVRYIILLGLNMAG